jgi:toxin ParE1/3/4
MTGYALHPDAFADLEEIREFIAQHNPDAAERIIAEIFEEFRSLARFPDSGHVRQDLTSRAVRFSIVREYLIAYAPEQPIWILGVLHGAAIPV